MIIGYARVSTLEQDTSAQREALTKAGAKRIFEETASGGKWERTELHRMLDHLREGDVVVVTKLDRLSRSLRDLLRLVERIDKVGAQFKSLDESVDTTSPMGRMAMQMIGVFAEFEREIIRERTRAGLAYAKSQGRVGGRRPKLNAAQKAAAIEMVQGGKTHKQVAEILGVSRPTITRVLQAHTGSLLLKPARPRCR